jgi:hypothetical protein
MGQHPVRFSARDAHVRYVLSQRASFWEASPAMRVLTAVTNVELQDVICRIVRQRPRRKLPSVRGPGASSRSNVSSTTAVVFLVCSVVASGLFESLIDLRSRAN